MSSQAPLAANIPISEQHSFLDLAKEFQWSEVKRCVNANPALVEVQPVGRQGGRRWSALHQAAFSGSADAVRFLLEHNAPVDSKTDDGKTPLEVAKNEGVRALLRDFHDGAKQPVPTPLRVRCSAMKAMKVGKGMKAMKTSKKKKIAKGKRGKSMVYKGKFEKTVGGLTKDALVKSRAGKIVSKRLHAHGKKSYSNIKSWVEAFLKARSELGLNGFVAIKKGSALYSKTMELYKQ
jgi:hypothetical protein|mmetsp:Transcript_101323/g.160214  ORF Transcript_101323/g.160214 Transcript_101323/m.160214 type:complete len:235 (+) Transcript_101323:74-778(+)